MVILHADGSQHSSVNENSLVVRLDLGSKRILLMGDAEAGGRRAPSSPPSSGSVERHLLECCKPELRADVLVVGHHGSRTSSRKEFLDAVGASAFLVSSGPKKYGSVVLPDEDVIEELERRGSVLRTDVDDENCALRATKIGPDADDRAGGCDHLRITISGSTLTPEMWTLSD